MEFFIKGQGLSWKKDCGVPVTMETKFVAMTTKKGSFVDQFGTYDHGIFDDRSNVWSEKDCWVPVTMETNLLPC